MKGFRDMVYRVWVARFPTFSVYRRRTVMRKSPDPSRSYFTVGLTKNGPFPFPNRKTVLFTLHAENSKYRRHITAKIDYAKKVQYDSLDSDPRGAEV